VVMVPERGCGLIVVVDVVAAAAWDVPLFGETIVFRATVSAVQMSDGTNFGVGGIEHVVVSAIGCGIDGQQMFLWQSVCEANSRGDAALSFDSDTGVAAVVAPHCGHGQLAVQASLELRHRDVSGSFCIRSDDDRQRQRIDVFGKRGGIDWHRQTGSAGGLR